MDVQCDGQGWCLVQTDRGCMPRGPCQHYCTPRKCRNYIVCNADFPEYIEQCHFKGLCVNCSMSGGDIGFIGKDATCQKCRKDKNLFYRLECRHEICVDCARDNWYVQSTNGITKCTSMCPHYRPARSAIRGEPVQKPHSRPSSLPRCEECRKKRNKHVTLQCGHVLCNTCHKKRVRRQGYRSSDERCDSVCPRYDPLPLDHPLRKTVA